jgi:hypothetical protein
MRIFMLYKKKVIELQRPIVCELDTRRMNKFLDTRRLHDMFSMPSEKKICKSELRIIIIIIIIITIFSQGVHSQK